MQICKTCYIHTHNTHNRNAQIVPGAEIKVRFRFMPALHESNGKNPEQNPFGGKKLMGKNLN